MSPVHISLDRIDFNVYVALVIIQTPNDTMNYPVLKWVQCVRVNL